MNHTHVQSRELDVQPLWMADRHRKQTKISDSFYIESLNGERLMKKTWTLALQPHAITELEVKIIRF